MSDRLTGLGTTLEEHRSANGMTVLGDVYRQIMEGLEATETHHLEVGELEVSGNVLKTSSGDIATIDSHGYEIIGKFFGIPTAYLLVS